MSFTNNPNFRKIAASLVLACLTSGALTGCVGHLPIPLPGGPHGRVVRTSKVNGPLCEGELGSVKVVFRNSGSSTPHTHWWLNSGVPPQAAGLVHHVQNPPGDTVTGITAGRHILYFSTVRPAVKPNPARIKVSASKTTVVEIEYR